ncbi:MAG: right-handed parallel beta-helix repeat-containing protein, partial [Chloroflexi bacterium]|nr:right-handed parallel beta-helix repeat-containing protein [Chloroflexota bacterium]
VAFTLDGFYLTRGNASNAPAWPRYGGALYANMITLRLHDCAFVDNVAYAAMASAGAASGGAVYVLNPYPTAVISGCRFVNNTAAHAPNTPGRGGALNVEGGIVGTLALVGNDFAGNVASIDGAGWGGAVALQAGRRSYTLDSNILVGNTGNYTSGQPGMGGGIYLWSAGPTTMTHNLVSGNTANGSTGEGYGGGLLILISPDVYLADNAIQENRATVSGFGGGGGLRANNSTLILAANRVCSNTVSADPTAGAQGGGLWLEIGDFDLVNNVIAGNEAGQAGAGVWLRGTLADGAAQARLAYNTIADNGGDGMTVGDYAQAMLTNTILAGNVAALRVSGATSSILVADHTLFWGNPTLVTGSHALVGEPDFVNPVAWDYAIGPASAARDVGVPVPGVTTDIAGHPRPAGAAPDIGAYEYQPVYWLYLPLVARD